ncbi:uncharacterized protein ATNIH1004_004276 [Aspergillus tanneri]|uniref:Uncharacterized protein n=1 Tax=Aspergillus tanneri TaxID=1220188 RepID=A0A5M9MMY9_9EURO|nr:uncharacterized protein ATNIH1004_004276 [Aspergillus tanneri]KAA8648391.1 hypothetical protein ATNIH1004_004276 [Aspergillus tanneri]
MRKRAWKIWGGANCKAPIILRTHYNVDDDGEIEKYAKASDNYFRGADWSVLNSSELFSFGPDWQQVFYILPEIAGCRSDYRRDKGCQNGPTTVEAGPESILLKDNLVAISLLHSISIAWVFIVDKEAFETHQLQVVYLDGKQNVTVQGRVEVKKDILHEIMLNWEEGAPPGPVFNEGTPGKKYLLGSEPGRKFSQLTHSDLVDEEDSD